MCTINKKTMMQGHEFNNRGESIVQFARLIKLLLIFARTTQQTFAEYIYEI